MIINRLYLVWSSSIILVSSPLYAMRVEPHPAAGTLVNMMLKQIAASQELHHAFYHDFTHTELFSNGMHFTKLELLAEAIRRHCINPAYTRESHYMQFHYTACRFNHSGSAFAVGSSQGLKIIDVASGKPLRSIAGLSHSLQTVAYSEDDTRIVSIDRTHRVDIYDAKSGSIITTYPSLIRLGKHLPSTISLDAKTIALQSAHVAIQLWTVDADQLTLQRTVPADVLARQLALSPDNSKLFVVKPTHAELYETATGNLLSSIKYSLEPNATFSSDGEWIAATYKHNPVDEHTNRMLIINTEKPGLRKKYKLANDNTITALAINQDGTRIAVHLSLPGISNHRLNIINMQTAPPEITHSLKSPWPAIKLMLSPDETHVVALGNRSIVTWDLCLTDFIARLPEEHRSFLFTAYLTAWARDDKYLVEPTNAHYLHLGRLRNGFLRCALPALFTLMDTATDEELPSPPQSPSRASKRQRIG